MYYHTETPGPSYQLNIAVRIIRTYIWSFSERQLREKFLWWTVCILIETTSPTTCIGSLHRVIWACIAWCRLFKYFDLGFANFSIFQIFPTVFFLVDAPKKPTHKCDSGILCFLLILFCSFAASNIKIREISKSSPSKVGFEGLRRHTTVVKNLIKNNT